MSANLGTNKNLRRNGSFIIICFSTFYIVCAAYCDRKICLYDLWRIRP